MTIFSGAHVILYSRDAQADRAFLAEVLELDHVDVGGGWLIFALPPSEVAVHPDDGPSRHELFLMCDDLSATMQTLTARGVEFTQPVTEQPWGSLTAFRLPGGSELVIYQPHHARP